MTKPRTNYIFVDYENVQKVDLQLIREKPVNVVLVVGERQKIMPSLARLGIEIGREQVEIVESGCTGKNALDLVLAYHVGRRAKEDPDGYFHILSNDKAFDALVAHLKEADVRAARAEVFDQIPVLRDVRTIPLAERVRQVKDRIGKLQPDGRPKKLKKLQSMIHSQFHKQLTEDDVDAVVTGLKKDKAITVSDKDSVSYAIGS
jgi:PIN domain